MENAYSEQTVTSCNPAYPSTQALPGYTPQGNSKQGHPPPAQSGSRVGFGNPASLSPAPAGTGFTVGPSSPQDDPPPEYSNSFADAPHNVFSEKAIRRAFIRKVYLILMAQLIVTVGFICMFVYWNTLNDWIWKNPWFTYALVPVLFVLIIILSCFENARRKVPLNFIFLALFTIVEGLMLGSTTVFFTADAVMWAVGATAFVSFGLSVFAMQTKVDFTIAVGTIWAVCLSLLAFGILCAIIRSRWLQIVYASIGTLIFAVYLVIDTQLMLGGNHKYSINPEEYVFAALNLYLDVIKLFLFILQITGLGK
ncbi:protein lifeguard 1-like [Acipenser ruthenus]|uniref:protein lifeguard 1-like n=1 Tax=Acipenser ruthenus TaxID=7906 RepID=UPI00145AF8EA|nr:protein lifeguard 1-like [Acipenser ruthenus]XP_058878486.1 protein lifeguard 1-like [Acipenser ruthenus]